MDQTPPNDDQAPLELTPVQRVHNELFQKSGASAEQIEAIKGWHKRLTDTAEALATEERIMAPHEQAAREERRQALTTRRHAGGLSPEEDAELRGIYTQMVEERERSEG